MLNSSCKTYVHIHTTSNRFPRIFYRYWTTRTSLRTVPNSLLRTYWSDMERLSIARAPRGWLAHPQISLRNLEMAGGMHQFTIVLIQMQTHQTLLGRKKARSNMHKCHPSHPQLIQLRTEIEIIRGHTLEGTQTPVNIVTMGMAIATVMATIMINLRITATRIGVDSLQIINKIL